MSSSAPSSLPPVVAHVVAAWESISNEPQHLPTSPPMTSIHLPLAACAAYLVVIFGLKAMLGTKPVTVNTRCVSPDGEVARPAPEPVSLPSYLFAIHNYLLSAFSLALCAGLTVEVLLLGRRYGGTALYCGAPDHSPLLSDDERRAAYETNVRILWYGNWFYLSKYWELLDTVLLVLRRKPLTLLHVFHHIAALMICWFAVHDAMGMGWITVWNNTAVHVLMYWYFARSVLGHHVWWRSYVTTLQILQFVSDASTSLPYLYFWANDIPCKGSLRVWCCANAVGLALFVLFVRFARQDPKRKAAAKAKRRGKAAAAVSTTDTPSTHAKVL